MKLVLYSIIISLILTILCKSYASENNICDSTIYLDPLPQTIYTEPKKFLTRQRAILIGRIANGIRKWKTTRDHGWWECGEYSNNETDITLRPAIWAYHIVRASNEYNGNPWGLAATIANESGFDQCAIGKYPRKWAIRHKVIKKNTRVLSYTFKDAISIINSSKARKYFKNSGFDIGPCQILTRFYEGKPKNMLTVVPGVDICAKEMNKRARMYNTHRPWLYWRGKKTQWYDNKVTRIARKLGAMSGDI